MGQRIALPAMSGSPVMVPGAAALQAAQLQGLPPGGGVAQAAALQGQTQTKI